MREQIIFISLVNDPFIPQAKFNIQRHGQYIKASKKTRESGPDPENATYFNLGHHSMMKLRVPFSDFSESTEHSLSGDLVLSSSQKGKNAMDGRTCNYQSS